MQQEKKLWEVRGDAASSSCQCTWQQPRASKASEHRVHAVMENRVGVHLILRGMRASSLQPLPLCPFLSYTFASFLCARQSSPRVSSSPSLLTPSRPTASFSASLRLFSSPSRNYSRVEPAFRWELARSRLSRSLATLGGIVLHLVRRWSFSAKG